MLAERVGPDAAAHNERDPDRAAELRYARLTASVPEQRYLTMRAARLYHPAPLPAEPPR
jgi:hypothetical protein